MQDAADAALIAELQLGAIEEVYTLKGARITYIILLSVLALLLVIFSLVAVSQLGPDQFPLLLIPWGILFLISGIWLYAFSSLRVYLCTHGLLSLQHKRRQSIRWEEVSLAYRYHPSRSYTWVYLTAQDGRRISFLQPDHAARFYHTLEAKGAHYHFRVIQR